MSVLAPSAANLWRVILSYGLDADALFLAEGLDVKSAVDPGDRFSYAAVDRVRARAAGLSGDPAFGLRAAEYFHPSQLGALGYAWLASTSLHTALCRLHRFARVINDSGHMELESQSGHAHVRLTIERDSENFTARDNAVMAMVLAMCRANLGPDQDPEAAHFVHDAPEDPEPYELLFRCPLKFGAPANTLVFLESDINRRLPSANPVLAQLNEQVVTRRLARLNAEDIPNQVRATIMENLTSGNVTDDMVAEKLHMTPRTLHRRLRSDGENFRGLLTEVRRDLAEQYISDYSLTLTEITFLLGFSEMSSFSRAYKNWNGLSPSEARKAAGR